MDKYTVEVLERYVVTGKVNSIQFNYENLSVDSQKQHTQFVENDVTMADHWLGVSGDSFLFAANTISNYMINALQFFDRNADLLAKYRLSFTDIDDVLAQDVNVEEK